VALNICDTLSCERLFQDIHPDWILNSAALTDVEYCEKHPREAQEVNAIAAEGLARIARRIGAGFVHVSTDSVFDGAGAPYQEADAARPVNAYAKSKLEAEERVLSAYPAALVIRVNFFGWGAGPKPSYNEWLLARLEKVEPFPVFSDVSFNPLLANTVAEMILDLTEQSQRGLVHLGCREPCTKLEFAYSLAEVFGTATTHFIRPTPVDAVGLAARRPRKTNLNTQLVERLLRRPMPTLREELVRLFNFGLTLRVELLNAMTKVMQNTCGTLL
jgi:dTDP-4-dehydrorhamnose reductase